MKRLSDLRNCTLGVAGVERSDPQIHWGLGRRGDLDPSHPLIRRVFI
jgi:hypothetical protein